MTEQQAIKIIKEEKSWESDDRKIDAFIMAIDALEEIKQYRAIGTVEECRAAVEKQKEMITYCDENDCADCPYNRGNMKENRCMNDFIAEKISKGVCNAYIDAIGGGGN